MPGHERGLACGSLNNHYGLGCHKDTCPAFGSEWDKSRGGKHVWKSSDIEASSEVPSDVWRQTLLDNPLILENWKKASHAMRNKGKPRVAAFRADDVDIPDQDVANA